MFRSILRVASATVAVFFLWASVAMAQTSGTILGTIHDSSGAIVPNAAITITNIDRGTSQTAVADQDGDYVVPFLPPGNYRVSVEKSGFQKEESLATQLEVDQRARVDFTLKPGSVQQTVEVSSAAPLIQSDSAALGQVIGEKSIQNLPLNGRNFAQLVYLVPGVTEGQQGENLAGNSTYNPRDSSAFNALGAQESTSAWLVDGIMDNEYTFNTVMVQPSVESIQEFKVLTGIYSAEYGRGSGIVTTQTRSGTNQFHGEALEFYRTSDLDARLYFNDVGTTKPAYIRNQWEAAVGGPIWKDKAFFFLDYFGETQIQGEPFVNTVPTALDRAGNFSDQSFTIYNPYSTTVNGSGQTVRTAFSGNVIPPQYLNPVGTTIANLYPLPNVTGALINNYIDTLDNSLVDNGGNARIDEKISDKDSIFARYSYERYTAFAAKGQSGCCIRTPPGLQQKYDLGPYISGGQNTVLLASGLAINETHVFSPKIINQFIAGYAHTNPLTRQSDYGLTGATALGIGGINISPATSGIPTFVIGSAGSGASYTAINDGPDFLPANPRETSYQLEDDVSWTKGAHQFSFGYRILREVDSPYSNSITRGTLNFQTNLTSYPVTAAGGSGLASLEMGLMANGTSADATRGFYLAIPVLTAYEDAAYVQDDWKASPRLTLNLGLRWDLFNPYTEKHNELTNYDPSTLSLIYAGVNGVGRTAGVQTQYHDFGPRIGFVYDLTGKGDFIVRGGYAISYTPQQPSGSEMLPENIPQTVSQNTPTTATYPICTAPCSNTPTGLANQTAITQPFPTPVPKQPFTTAQMIADNPSVVGVAFANHTPSFANWTLNIQKQFANDYMVEIAYVGSRSVHLLFYSNQQEVQPGPTSEPVADRITIPALYPMLTIDQSQNRNYANFNGMTAKLTKRLSHGLSSITSYTWSKVLDDAGSQANGGGYVGNPQTITNLAAGYGPSGYNIPQRFVESWVWNLPAGPGRAFLNHGGIAAYILGGWELDGIATIQSGFPFTVDNMTSCPNNAGNCWPDLVGNPRAGFHQSYAMWYNPAAYAVPCQVAVTSTGACSVPAYRYGNNGRATLRGPQTVNFDLSVAKTFPIRRTLAVQFRLDAFDALNHPVLGVPNQTINVNAPSQSSTAITTTEADNRDLQGSLRLTF